MKPADDREEALFREALQRLRGPEREAFLNQACAGNPALRSRLETLIQTHESAEPLLEPPEEGPGSLIGRYKILEKIGEGGFGVVYVAEQQEPVKRRVAVKIIKLGMDTRQVVARFEAERQALALMDHPNIAKVLDAGATDKGRPYFVMELVKGIPIIRYCDQEKLATRERLDLFIKVCRAIQHAHQKGIIHRDIKPSNILVTLHDGVPVPKVIDFGIAKATGGQVLTNKTLYTAFEQFIGTPAYMSPEQAEMSGLDIDTRSDIYALGVLLYELLTGQTPFDQKELVAAGLDEMRRIIREKEPVRPSTRLSTLDDAVRTTAARRRDSEPAQLIHLLRGDLDWIVMKCLEKDRTRRYETANGVATDIERHLHSEPVVARPPSTAYQAAKFCRRHRFGVAAAAVLIFVLVAGTIGMAVQARRIAGERDRANREAEAAQEVANFLVRIFAVSNPSEARGNTITAREILDRGAQRIERELTNQPLIQAKLMDTMGRVYRGLGLQNQAEPLLQKALRIRRDLLGEDNLEYAKTLTTLANLLWDKADFASARPMFERALAIRQKVLGPDDPEVASSYHNLANLFFRQGDFAAARPLFDRALLIREKTLGPTHAEVANTLNSLGALEYRLWDLTKAKALWERSLTIREQALGADHPFLAQTCNNLGLLYKDLADYPKAKAMLQRAIRIQEKSLGPAHADLASSLHNLGDVLRKGGELGEARLVLQRAIRIRENASGPDHPELGHILFSLAELEREAGNYDAAKPLYDRALAIEEKAFGNDNPDFAWYLAGLGNLRRDQGQRAEAEQLYQRALRIYEKSSAMATSPAGEILDNLAKLYQDWGRMPEAEQCYQRALQISEQTYGPNHPDTIRRHKRLAEVTKPGQKDPTIQPPGQNQ
jgi:tetratricopeptide (TPR) repeat protein/tRNA A-37 threonylcarbamoyl transferase component Bud32